MKKDHNLNNPKSEPEHATIECIVSVHFELISPVPKQKMAQWLASLPDDAKVKFIGISSGKVQFQASWTETR